MISGAERDRPLITDLASEGTGLSKAQMVSLGRRSPAYDAELLGDIEEVFLVEDPPCRGNR